jgi:uncharacterized protein
MTATPAPIASTRHTAILASVFLLFGVLGAYGQHAGAIQRAAPTEEQAIRLYLSVLVVEWASVFYVWKGIRGSHVRLLDLVGGRWRNAADVATDLGLAAALWAVWIGIELTLPSANSASTLLPHTGVETAIWILVALSAGFCEEVVFRGYFQTQFHALTRSLPAAVPVQAAVFGLAHFYEGAGTVLSITLYGVLFGTLAARRRSLRPGIIAHAWSDLFGIIFFARR